MPTPTLSDALARATEAAARATYAHLGRGDLTCIDAAAVDAMRQTLDAGQLAGTIAIGEGEKDEAPMLRMGEAVGPTGAPVVDLAVDPVDGTRPAALGEPGAVSALAAAPAGRLYRPGQVAYMEKLVAPPGASLDLDMSTEEIVNTAARTLGTDASGLRVAVLDRPRNAQRMQEVRDAGAQLVPLPYADLSACIAVAIGHGDIDLLLGIGGCAEGVIAAVAASAVGATMQCRLWPRSTEERHAAEASGLSCSTVLDAKSMTGSEQLGVALSGITGGILVDPISSDGSTLTVHTLRIESGRPPVFTRNSL